MKPDPPPSVTWAAACRDRAAGSACLLAPAGADVEEAMSPADTARAGTTGFEVGLRKFWWRRGGQGRGGQVVQASRQTMPARVNMQQW